MPSNIISRSMIVQSMDKGHNQACVLLTNLTDEQLQAGPQPAMCTPECTPIPLTKSLEELWSEWSSGYGPSRGGLEMTDCQGNDVRIISDARYGTEYKFVGLVGGGGTHHADEIHCYNNEGKCEDGDELNLYSYPEERHGYIAIYRGMVSSHICTNIHDAIQDLKTVNGMTTDLDPKEVFILEVGAWVNPETEAVI